MFAYLFFFANVSLFNQLMDKGSAKGGGLLQLLQKDRVREREGGERVRPYVLVSILTETNSDLSSMPFSYLRRSPSPYSSSPSFLPSGHQGVRQREAGLGWGYTEQSEEIE